MLGCILDYQIPAEAAWRNAKRVAEEILGDPVNLWDAITSCSLDERNSRRETYRLHRFPKAHERVYTIGEQVVVRYSGDARQIWSGQSLEAVLFRLNDIRLGEQISCMLAGALLDAGIVSGRGDVKVDVHVRRVGLTNAEAVKRFIDCSLHSLLFDSKTRSVVRLLGVGAVFVLGSEALHFVVRDPLHYLLEPTPPVSESTTGPLGWSSCGLAALLTAAFGPTKHASGEI